MNHFFTLSIIFIMGLLFCSFLGGYCGLSKEGFQTTTSNPNSAKTPNTPKSQGQVTPDGQISVSSITGVQNTGNSSTNYDNYNHFTRDSHPSVFYGPNGETATVFNSNGKYILLIVDSDGVNNIYETSSGIMSGSSSAAPSFYPHHKTKLAGQGNMYYNSNGGVAVITKDDKGHYSVFVTQPDNTVVVYNSTNVPTSPSSAMPTTTSAFPSSSVPISSSAIPSSAVPSSIYNSSLPKGVPKSQIPPGQEDLYILKSQVVPPVCPACPSCQTINSTSYSNGKKKCPPCPACERCPEPNFDCKKTYNYNSSGNSSANVPMPILNSFTTFGM
jgi:hypothetical protein